MEFSSYRSYWDFDMSVTNRWRYARSPEQAKFLETVLSTSADKGEVVPAGSLLWRAQGGHDWREENLGAGEREKFSCPYSPERMKPLIDRAFEGRANPKGIPYLYLATHEATAVAEVGLWRKRPRPCIPHTDDRYKSGGADSGQTLKFAAELPRKKVAFRKF